MDRAKTKCSDRDNHDAWMLAHKAIAGMPSFIGFGKEEAVRAMACFILHKTPDADWCSRREPISHVLLLCRDRSHLKLFGKDHLTDFPVRSLPTLHDNSAQEVEVKDISLTDYIALRNAVYTPHTAGRYQNKAFKKAQTPIVERLVNSLMMHGRNNGKKLMAVRIVAHAFEIINLLTDANPIQILVDAIINTGPREDSTRIGSAGTVRRQAVDVSPLRRVNTAITLLTTGTRESAFRNVKSIAECLADELINAAKGSSNSYAIKKRDEMERVARSNR